MMTTMEYARMNWLCKQIQEENDPKKFSKLVLELNDLLGKAAERTTRRVGDVNHAA